MRSSQRFNRRSTTPLRYNRTVRPHNVRALTSMPAGKIVPVEFIPLLPEDEVRAGRLRFQVEMNESVEIIMNSIRVKAQAWLVPTVAFERFNKSMDLWQRSFAGEALGDDDVVDYIELEAAGAHGANKILKYAGKHAKPGSMINTAYTEAYNLMVNHRYIQRSPELEGALRTRLESSTLADALWDHQNFQELVPDFDQATIAGEVPLNVANARMPVKGIGVGTKTYGTSNQAAYETDATATVNYQYAKRINPADDNERLYVRGTAAANGLLDVYAELEQNGITVSLANIDLARRTAAYAKLKQQFKGHAEEWQVDALLMNGMHVPDMALMQPIMLAESNNVIAFNKRWATTAGEMTDSVVNGMTVLDMGYGVPRLNTGGVIVITVEAYPDQLWERQMDPYLHLEAVKKDGYEIGGMPSAMRDDLDPEKVVVVPNKYLDVNHTTPEGKLAYAPLNFEWIYDRPSIGGDYFRPAVNTTTDDKRQRIWAVEVVDPVLSEAFYKITDMHAKPFVDQLADTFEVACVGQNIIAGNTVFGSALLESSDTFDEIEAEVPDSVIDKTETTA